MKRAIILLAIFFLAISGVYGAAYPGGFFRDSIDMRGHEITNASNLATTSDVSGVVSQLSQSLSDDENSTAQSLSAINGTLDNHAQGISDLQNGTAAINRTIGGLPDYGQEVRDLQNFTEGAATLQDIQDQQNYTAEMVRDRASAQDLVNTTENVTDLQGDMSGVLAGTFMVVETQIIPGESAGNHTIAAIVSTDFLDKVYFMKAVEGDLAITDITSEFRGGGHSSGVVTDGLINNNNGTDTTGGFMMVSWYTRYMLFGG